MYLIIRQRSEYSHYRFGKLVQKELITSRGFDKYFRYIDQNEVCILLNYVYF